MQTIQTLEGLEEAIDAFGILPFFRSRIPGWSLEDYVAPGVWFTDREGPWEWKGQLALQRICVYGKFIRGKAAFVSPDCFGDLMNLRRLGMTFEERLEEGLVPYDDKRLMDYLRPRPNVLSKHARRECGLSKGYDAALTRLQMSTDVILCDFRYSLDRTGKPYGWGNAALDLPERWFGEGLFAEALERTPQESEARLISRIRHALPTVREDLLLKHLR